MNEMRNFKTWRFGLVKKVLRCGRSPTEPQPTDRRSPLSAVATGETSGPASCVVTDHRTRTAMATPVQNTLTPPL